MVHPVLAHSARQRYLPTMVLWCGLVGMVFSACGPGDEQLESVHRSDAGIAVVGSVSFDSVFTRTDSIVLEETSSVVNIWPVASMDANGGYIVADTREDQLRVYSPVGELRNAYGPGTGRLDSLQFLARAIRLPNGKILAASLVGHLTLIPEEDDTPNQVISTPLVRLRDVIAFDERRLLLVGLDSIPTKALLHFWDTDTKTIVRSFFSPPDRFDAGVTSTFPTVAVAKRGNRVAAAYTLSDTLIVFDTLGAELSRARIPIDPFHAPAGSLPPANGPEEQQEVINRFTFIQDLFWISDDRLLVQWAKGTVNGMQWGIIETDPLGNRVWGIAPTPRLIGIDGEKFIFANPASEASNQWIIALKR